MQLFTPLPTVSLTYFLALMWVNPWINLLQVIPIYSLDICLSSQNQDFWGVQELWLHFIVETGLPSKHPQVGLHFSSGSTLIFPRCYLSSKISIPEWIFSKLVYCRAIYLRHQFIIIIFFFSSPMVTSRLLHQWNTTYTIPLQHLEPFQHSECYPSTWSFLWHRARKDCSCTQ